MQKINNIKIRSLLVVLLLAFGFPLFSQVKKDNLVQTTLSLGPVLSIYKGNVNHTSGLRSKMAFNATARAYLRLNKISFFYAGINYLTHGCSFNSYYFPDSTLHMYTKEYEYNYSARFQDVSFPMGIRAKVTENRQKKNDLYVELGWAIKRRFITELDVTSNSYGTSMYYDVAGNKFNTLFKNKRNGTSLLMAVGYDRNFRDKHSGYFVELHLHYGLSRFSFYKDSNFPNSLYLVERLIALNVGVRF